MIVLVAVPEMVRPALDLSVFHTLPFFVMVQELMLAAFQFSVTGFPFATRLGLALIETKGIRTITCRIFDLIVPIGPVHNVWYRVFVIIDPVETVPLVFPPVEKLPSFATHEVTLVEDHVTFID